MKFVNRFNKIQDQKKSGSDRIIASEWNFIINTLKSQTNNNSEGIKEIIDLLLELKKTNKQIELRSENTWIQWKYIDEEKWVNLIEIKELEENEVNQIRNGFVNSLRKSYKEVEKTNGKITKIEIWEDDQKTNHLFTKNINYNLDNKVSVIEVLDRKTGATLNKEIIYLEGEVFSIKEEIVL